MPGVPWRRACEARTKSARLVRRQTETAGVPATGPTGGFKSVKSNAGAYALSFARPLARRLFRILRPAFVAMRARNPWRFLRTRFDGWNVRFIACSPVYGQIHERDSKPNYNSDPSFRGGLAACQRNQRGETATIPTFSPYQMFQSSRTIHPKLKHVGVFTSMGCEVGIAKQALRPSNLQIKT